MTEETRSVFLYGNPTKVKMDCLIQTQNEYTDLVNHFIGLLASDHQYYLDLFNNNKQSPKIRLLEKVEREKHRLGSAFGQNAIDMAVKELHNHFTRIKNSLFGYYNNEDKKMTPYVSSIALLNSALLGLNEIDVIQHMIHLELSKKKVDNEKLVFYRNLENYIKNLNEVQREEYKNTTKEHFLEKVTHWKLPFVKKATVQLDSRVCTIEVSENIAAEWVISLKVVGMKGRISIPLYGSENGIRRLKQYKNCSPTYTIKNGRIKVGIPFKKKIKNVKTKELLGVDVGIVDVMYSSDGRNYGSFSGMTGFYNEVIGKKEKNRSTLRNKMRTYQKQLKTTNHPYEADWLRNKIKQMNRILQGGKKFNRCKRRYAHEVDVRLSSSIKGLISDLKKEPKTVVLEDLEITKFDNGKQTNKRNSSWARGQLIKRLSSKLNWLGIPMIKVDPAYTSQMCHKCYHVDKKNRNGKVFCCTVCKHKTDADLNASVNIRNRANDHEIREVTEKYPYSTKKRHKGIKEILVTRHRSQLENPAV